MNALAIIAAAIGLDYLRRKRIGLGDDDPFAALEARMAAEEARARAAFQYSLRTRTPTWGGDPKDPGYAEAARSQPTAPPGTPSGPVPVVIMRTRPTIPAPRPAPTVIPVPRPVAPPPKPVAMRARVVLSRAPKVTKQYSTWKPNLIDTVAKGFLSERTATAQKNRLARVRAQQDQARRIIESRTIKRMHDDLGYPYRGLFQGEQEYLADVARWEREWQRVQGMSAPRTTREMQNIIDNPIFAQRKREVEAYEKAWTKKHGRRYPSTPEEMEQLRTVARQEDVVTAFQQEQAELKRGMEAEERERKRLQGIKSTFEKTFDMHPQWFGMEGEASMAKRWEERFGTPYPRFIADKEKALQNSRAIFGAESEITRQRTEKHRVKMEAQLAQEIENKKEELAGEVSKLRKELERERLERQGFMGEDMRQINKRNYINQNLQQYYSSKITEEATSSSGHYDAAKADKLTMQYAKKLGEKFEKQNPPKKAPEFIGIPLIDQLATDLVSAETSKKLSKNYIKSIVPYRSGHGTDTPDSATRMLTGWAKNMIGELKLDPSKLAKITKEFVENAVKGRSKSAIARAYTLAADSHISNEERAPRLIELARTLNAVTTAVIEEETPRALARAGLPNLVDEFLAKAGPAPRVIRRETGPEAIARLKREEALRTAPIDPFAATIEGIGALEFGTRLR